MGDYSHEQLHTDIGRLQSSMDKIHEYQSSHDERIHRLESWKGGIDTIMFGDRRSDSVGLVQKARDTQAMLDEWRQLRGTVKAAQRALYAVAGTVLTVGGGWLLHTIIG